MTSQLPHLRHKRNNFYCQIVKPEFKILSPNEEPLNVHIGYQLTRLHSILSVEPRKSRILERRVEKRAVEFEALLSQLESFKDSSLALRALSELGVKRSKHRSIITKKIANFARFIKFQIEERRRLGEERRIGIEAIEILLLRSQCTWLCDECLRDRERKRKIKMVISDHDHHDDDDHDRDRDDDDDKCSICLEELFGVKKLGVVRLPCDHKFHARCILTWLMESSSCPFCRFHMPSLEI